MGAPSGAGAVDRQADPVAILEGLVPFGTTDDGEQGLASRAGIQALREIAQGIIAERSWRDFFVPQSAPVLRRHESCVDGGFDRPAKPRVEAAREAEVVADRLPDPEDIS